MTRDVLAASPSTAVPEAMAIMVDGKFRHLPVVKDGRVVGMISMRDLMAWASLTIRSGGHSELDEVDTAELLAAWAAKQGLDRAKFLEQYNSFPVVTKVRRATQLQEQYKVDGVPSLGIAGRYFTSGSMAGNMQKALQVTDYLIAQASKRSKA